jgi:hypothetical protein
MDNHYHLLVRSRQANLKKRCSGLEPPTRSGSIVVTIEAVIYFKVAIKVLLCKKYLPSKTDNSIPHQRQISKDLNTAKFLKDAGKILNCNVSRIVKAGRLSGPENNTRDLLLNYIWRAGRLTNVQIGKELV